MIFRGDIDVLGGLDGWGDDGELGAACPTGLCAIANPNGQECVPPGSVVPIGNGQWMQINADCTRTVVSQPCPTGQCAGPLGGCYPIGTKVLLDDVTGRSCYIWPDCTCQATAYVAPPTPADAVKLCARKAAGNAYYIAPPNGTCTICGPGQAIVWTNGVPSCGSPPTCPICQSCPTCPTCQTCPVCQTCPTCPTCAPPKLCPSGQFLNTATGQCVVPPGPTCPTMPNSSTPWLYDTVAKKCLPCMSGQVLHSGGGAWTCINPPPPVCPTCPTCQPGVTCPSCAAGQMWDFATQACVTPPDCPSGLAYDFTKQACVSIDPGAPPAPQCPSCPPPPAQSPGVLWFWGMLGGVSVVAALIGLAKLEVVT